MRFSKIPVKRLLLFGIIIVCTAAFIAKAIVCQPLSLIDEANMYATSYRFYLGDAVLVEDWSPEQLFGVALLPFFYLFRAFSGSNEGLFLFLSLCFLALKLLVLIYGLMKASHIHLNKTSVCIGLFIWYFFSCFNMDTLTYQNLPLLVGMFILIGVLADNTSRFTYVLMGAAYAFAVLSMPYIVISYPFVLILSVVKSVKKRKPDAKAAAFHLGILLVFIWFVYLVLSRSSVDEVRRNLPYILHEPDHNMSGSGLSGMLIKVKLTCKELLKLCKPVTYLQTGIFILLGIVFVLKRKYLEFLRPIIPAALLGSVLYIVHTNDDLWNMNMMFIPFMFAAVEAFFFIRDKRYLLYLTAACLYVLSVALGTSTGALATSGAICVVAVVFVFFWREDDRILQDSAEGRSNLAIGRNQKLSAVVSAAAFVGIAGVILFLRMYLICFSLPLSSEDYENKITVGPMKGMYANDWLYDSYIAIWNEVSCIDRTEEDILFCGTSSPMVFLDAEVNYGTMGVPFYYLDYDRLKTYWEMHPDKLPTIIYYSDYTDEDSESFVNDMIEEEFDCRREGDALIAVKKKNVDR